MKKYIICCRLRSVIVTPRSGQSYLHIQSEYVKREIGHVAVDLYVGDLAGADLGEAAGDDCGGVERGKVVGHKGAR